jgi:hypothetical protein
MKSVVALLVVFAAMGITFGLVRFVANLVIIAAGVAAFWFVHSGIQQGDFVSWSDILFASAVAGGAVGIVCTPLLPISDWGRDRDRRRPRPGKPKPEDDDQ